MSLHQLLLAVLLLCLLGVSRSETQNEAQTAIASANNKFGSKVYEVLRRQPGNVFFSPTSVETVLAMALMGAVGETAQEMSKSLELNYDWQVIQEGFRSLLTTFEAANNDVTLNLANKIFTQEESEIKESFQQTVSQYFLAEAQEVNFHRNHEAAGVINQWVEQKTRNRIKNLISPDSLDARTVMVLVNAIYFKGKWKNQFLPHTTYPQPFHLDSSTTQEVQMMHITNDFPYAYLPDMKAKILQMPYVGEHLHMVVLLPDDIDGLPQVEAALVGKDIHQLTKALSVTEVEVSLPKFRLETTIEFNDVLQELGMTNMFSINANFSGIAKRMLAVSRVVQKAFVEVNEEGSEAAAATGVIFPPRGPALPPIRPPPFVADHPFIFAVHHSESGSVLFQGRLVQP